MTTMNTEETRNDIIKEDCQLEWIFTGAQPLSWLDKVIQLSLRIKSAIRRRAEKWFIASKESPTIDNGIQKEFDFLSRSLKTGDNVVVLPLEEILKTLDSDYLFDGLEFMAGMKNHCGKKYKVMKKVRMIFDERKRKMVRINDTVILKDVICDGTDMYSKEGCDRCCFYFWKERWLQKVR